MTVPLTTWPTRTIWAKASSSQASPSQPSPPNQVDAESTECDLLYVHKFIEPADVERVRDYNGKETPYPKGYEFSMSDAEREELGLKP